MVRKTVFCWILLLSFMMEIGFAQAGNWNMRFNITGTTLSLWPSAHLNDDTYKVDYSIANGAKTGEYVMACLSTAASNSNTTISYQTSLGDPFMVFAANWEPNYLFKIGFRSYSGGDEVFIWDDMGFSSSAPPTYHLKLPSNASPDQILKFDYIVGFVIKFIFIDLAVGVSEGGQPPRNHINFSITVDANNFPTGISYSEVD